MVEMRVSQPEDLAAQKKLWRTTFGDEDQCIDWFYERCEGVHSLLLLEDGVIASMLALLPMELALPGGGRAQAAYVYALATDPQARKRGYGRQLLRQVDVYLQERGIDCVTVVPAEPSLHKFFGTVDYRPCFTTRKQELLSNMVEPPSAADGIRPVRAEEYNQIRGRILEQEAAALYPDVLIRYQKGISKMAGADLYGLMVDGMEGCCTAEYVDEESLLLKELLIAPEQMGRALAQVAQLLPARRYHIRTPAGWDGLPGGYHQAFGMVKWYNQEKEALWGNGTRGYLGLGFD